ncbi:MAG: hypothetical protein F6K19_23100 [Cyanothece sp. SIO1E1]|nr:hypothetical protein [Cyanothece sp. SIO1E1]
MKVTMNWDWGKIKTVVETIAIFGAALFALFTWGFDYLRLSDPNWSVGFNETTQLNAVTKGERTKICSKKDCPEATTCVLTGSVQTVNKGKKPLFMRDTFIYFYLFEKIDNEPVVNASLYNYFKDIKNPELQNYSLLDSIVIGSIDDQPLFPEQSAIRPFSIEINPTLFENEESLVEFSNKYDLLIVADQYLVPDLIRPRQIEQHSTAGNLIENICHQSYFKSAKAD